MCGRFLLEAEIDDLMRYYNIANAADFTIEHKTVYPSQATPVVIRHDAENRMGKMHWGFVIPGVKKLIINSRVESIFEKKSFKASIEQRRCIVPATAFLEWKDKKPYTVKFDEDALMSFAGIYKKHIGETGEPVWQFSILTREANGSMAPLHERMPLMLPSQSFEAWMDPATNLDEIHHLLNHDIGKVLWSMC
jgi:putative SOS response-associated peptidase YedK